MTVFSGPARSPVEKAVTTVVATTVVTCVFSTSQLRIEIVDRYSQEINRSIVAEYTIVPSLEAAAAAAVWTAAAAAV